MNIFDYLKGFTKNISKETDYWEKKSIEFIDNVGPDGNIYSEKLLYEQEKQTTINRLKRSEYDSFVEYNNDTILF